MKTLIHSLILFFLSSLLFACKKEDEPVEGNAGQAKLKFQVTVNDFANDLLSGKMASTYSYQPDEVSTVDFNSDYMIQAELTPMTVNNHPMGSKLLKSNNKLAAETPIQTGDVYRVIIYDKNGKYADLYDGKKGSEQYMPPVYLTKGEVYTFVGYTIEGIRFYDSLNKMLYLNDIVDPDLDDLIASATLDNTTLRINGNTDVLLFRKTVTIPNSDTYYLNLQFDHSMNLLQTTINVEETGYGITDLQASLVTKTNNSEYNFNTGQFTHSNQTATQAFSNFTYEAVNGVANAKAVSNQIVLNTASGESLLQITKLQIGEITNPRTITPFATRGVALQPGHKYNLNVTIVPKDSIYIYQNQQVARINGQVWMRYNLGAPGISNNNSDPDNNSDSNYLGLYWQWGQKEPSKDINSNDLPGLTNKSITDPNFYKVWNAGTEANPIRGLNDPCPTGFRLPTKAEYSFLLNTTQNSVSYAYIGTKGQDSYALQLTSKRNKNVKLTFPGQGFFTTGSDNAALTNGLANNIQNRGSYALARSSTYTSFGSIDVSGTNVYRFQYSSLQGNNGAAPSIFQGPSAAPVSASIPAHPIRCIAESTTSRGVNFMERENDRNEQTVGF